MAREDRHAKAARLLTSGRVLVDIARGRYIRAVVRGDSGTYYPVIHDAGAWTCPCECRRVCSHVQAVMLVTAPIRLGGAS
jgi:uncharacterized Zn finger protein